MLKIMVTDDAFFLKIPYKRKEEAKFGGYSWNKDLKAWKYPIQSLRQAVKKFPSLKEDREVAGKLALLDKQTSEIDKIKSGKVLAKTDDWLMDHQKIAVTLGLKNDSFAFFLDMGTGKTVIILSIIKQLKPKRCLIVAPLSLLSGAWEEDILKWGFDIPYHIYQGPKRSLKEYDEGILLTNYASYRIDWEKITKIDFDMMVIDESACMKNPKAKLTKALLKHGYSVPRKYLLSGCPAPNTPLEYFPQIRLIDESIFGKSYYKFQSQWAYPVGPKGGDWKKWVFDKDRYPDFADMFAHKSYVVTKEDCLDLPKALHHPIKLDFEKKQAKIYSEMRDEFLSTVDSDTVIAERKITQIMKLRQVTSGFMYGEDKKVITVPTMKDNALLDILEGIGKEQVIVWCNFKAEFEKLMDVLGNKMYSVCCAYGDISYESQKENLRNFKRGETQVLLAHPASIGHGQTLVNCKYEVYFSMSHSYELYAQSRDRIHRAGQERKCEFFYLLVKNSLDCTIYNAVRQKKNVFEHVRDIIQGIINEE